jgi:hypothetical protein
MRKILLILFIIPLIGIAQHPVGVLESGQKPYFNKNARVRDSLGVDKILLTDTVKANYDSWVTFQNAIAIRSILNDTSLYIKMSGGAGSDAGIVIDADLASNSEFGLQIKGTNEAITISKSSLVTSNATGIRITDRDSAIIAKGLSYFEKVVTDTALVNKAVIAPLIYGGRLTSSDLYFITTPAAGATGADMHFGVGNNGGTEGLTILNSGKTLVNYNLGVRSLDPLSNLDVVGSNATNLGMFNFVNSDINKNRTTIGEATDTSSLFGQFTASGKFNLRLKNQIGNDVFQVDTFGTFRIGALSNQYAKTIPGLIVEGTATYMSCISTTASGTNSGGQIEIGGDDNNVWGAGHRLGSLYFSGGTSTSHTVGTGASIEAYANTAFSATNRNANILFKTCPAASITLTERMSINGDGSIKFNTDRFTSDINGNTVIKGTTSLDGGTYITDIIPAAKALVTIDAVTGKLDNIAISSFDLGLTKVLTNATPTSIYSYTVASDTNTYGNTFSGTIDYSISVRGSDGVQSISGVWGYNGGEYLGAVTLTPCQDMISSFYTSLALGTLTAVPTITYSAGVITVKVTATSSLTSPVYKLTYHAHPGNSGTITQL